MIEYEYRDLQFGREFTRNTVVRLLNEQAEYGRWELARVRLTSDGRRTVRLRRKMIRVARTA